MEAMRQMQDLDQLEQSLQQAMRTRQPGRRRSGKNWRNCWAKKRGAPGRNWTVLRQMLKDAGYITDDDQLNLTARGIPPHRPEGHARGFPAAQEGSHRQTTTWTPAALGAICWATPRPTSSGDPLQLDLQTTVKNAIVRSGPQVPVKLRPDDFEIYRNEHMTRAAHHRPAGSEPIHGTVQQLGGGEEGDPGAVRPDPPAVPPGHPPTSSGSPTTPASWRRKTWPG